MGSALGSIAGPIIGGLMGGGGGGGGGSAGGTQVMKTVPWEGLEPYLTGKSDYVPQTNKPLSSDWLHWMYLTAQGAPYGPPPPMYVDDPRYTGENVYDPPFQYQQGRTEGIGYGQDTPFGSGKPSGGGLFGGADVSDYPSSGKDPNALNNVGGNGVGEPEKEEEEEGLSDLDLYILKQARDAAKRHQASDPDGGGFMPSGGRVSKEGQAFIDSFKAKYDSAPEAEYEFQKYLRQKLQSLYG